MEERSLTSRMIGAATLNVATYEEVEANESLTKQAALVVVIVAVASAIGGAGSGGPGMIGGVVRAVAFWLLWAGLTYVIGDKLLKGTATWGELLRTLGYAQSPGVFLILGIVPVLGGIAQLVVAIWLLVTGVVAIRQALDFSTGKALLTAFLGWIVLMIISYLIWGGTAV